MIIRHDRTDHEILVDPDEGPAITTFFQGRGAGSLIAPTWLLTAAHVARRIPTDRAFSVELVGKPYLIARVLLHPSYNPQWDQKEVEKEQLSKTGDIALVELATPVEHAVPYELYTRSDEAGQVRRDYLCNFPSHNRTKVLCNCSDLLETCQKPPHKL